MNVPFTFTLASSRLPRAPKPSEETVEAAASDVSETGLVGYTAVLVACGYMGKLRSSAGFSTAGRRLVASTIEKCREVLQSHYGDRLAGIVLFGSSARGGGGPESDLDLLVLLKAPLDYFGELRSLSDVLYAVQLEEDRLISAKPAAVDEFERGAIQLYRNAKREGLPL